MQAEAWSVGGWLWQSSSGSVCWVAPCCDGKFRSHQFALCYFKACHSWVFREEISFCLKSSSFHFQEKRKRPLLRLLSLHTVFLLNSRDGWDVGRIILLLIRARALKRVSIWNSLYTLVSIVSFSEDLVHCWSWWVQFSLVIIHYSIMTMPIQWMLSFVLLSNILSFLEACCFEMDHITLFYKLMNLFTT